MSKTISATEYDRRLARAEAIAAGASTLATWHERWQRCRASKSRAWAGGPDDLRQENGEGAYGPLSYAYERRLERAYRCTNARTS